MYELEIRQPSQCLELTPLHTALSRADLGMISDILGAVEDKVRRKVLSCPLVALENQKSRPADIPIRLTYIAYIMHLLSKEEIQKVAFELEIIRHGPLYADLISRIPSTSYVQLPLSMICASGDIMAVRDLLMYGARLDCCDSKNENLFHHLVRLSQATPQTAVRMYKFIIDEYCDIETRRTMLGTKNIEGKRPLDLAGKLGLPEMMKEIMNTCGVYKFFFEVFGPHCLLRYDVTDYEAENAKIHQSLLSYLTDMDESQLERALKCRLLSTEPFQSWIETKCQLGQRLVIGFAMFWSLLVSCFWLSMLSYFESGKPQPGFLCIAIVLALFYLIVNISNTGSNIREIFSSVKGMVMNGRTAVTFTFAYRVFQILFCVLLVLSGIYSVSVQSDDNNDLLCALVFCSFFSSLSFLFFIQMQGSAGHLLVIFQKVIFDTCFFLAMVFVIFFAFAFSLYLLHFKVNTKNATQNNRFSGNFEFAMYETLLLMFAVKAPDDPLFGHAKLPSIAIFLYVVLLISMTVIYLNLLISIMTKRTDDISKLKCEILKLERVSIVLYLDERYKTKLFTIILKYYRRAVRCFPKLKFLKLISPKNPRLSFNRTEEGQIFLDVIELQEEHQDYGDLQ